MLPNDLRAPADAAPMRGKGEEVASPMTNAVGDFNSAILARTGIWVPDNPEDVELSDDRRVLIFPAPADYQSRPIQEWRWHRQTETERMLQRFIAIKDEDDAKRFAREWGPLWWLEPEELGRSQFWDGTYYTSLSGGGKDRTLSRNIHASVPWTTTEPIKAWLGLAARARATLRLAALVRSGQVSEITPELWEDVGWFPPPQYVDPERARRMLARVVNAHCVDMQVGPRLRVTEPDLVPTVDTGLGFFGAAWYEILQIVAGVKAVFVCANCHNLTFLYGDDRAPSMARRAYCHACRQEDHRRVKRDQASAARAELKMLAEFVGERLPSEIGQVRMAWNDAHPELRLNDDDEFRARLVFALQGGYKALNHKGRQRLLESALAGLRGFQIDETDLKPKAESGNRSGEYK